jgi:O-methyltransferase
VTRDAEALLAGARAARARGPGAEPETLRTAYLELLKLCLCDLAGPTTQSVGALPDGVVMARELRGEGLRLRAAGMDWPLQGLTMIGLRRLDDLQHCVEAVVRAGVPGDLIEAGAWRGGASMLMRATLDSLGDSRKVVVADSFQGFPAGAGGDLSGIDFLAVSLDEVRDSFARLGLEDGVEFVPGFFEESLADLAGRPWAIVRLDADTYQPTRAALDALYPGLAPGGYLIADDYGSFDDCRRAIDEFRQEHGIAEPLETIDFTAARWRRESAAPITPRMRPSRAPAPHVVERPSAVHVPTAAELELARERDALRARLAAAEAQIGLRPWLRRILRRDR